MSLEIMVTWYLNIACKVRLGKCPIDQVSAEDLTRNSNKLVRGLRVPPQQMRRHAITKNKTKDQSVN